MKISINEPCHENWDAMTPNTQGAFCKSCAKDVVDFSKMGIAEIKSFFSKPQSGKTCGRFEETQLQELTFDDFFSKFTYWNFAKKFAVIFFFTFGFALFSTNVLAQDNRHMMKGEVAVMPDKNPKKDTTKKQEPKQLNDQKNIKMGKIKCERPTTKQEKVNEPLMIMGDIAAPIEEKKVEPVKNDSTKNENMIMGMIAVRTQPIKNQEPIKANVTKNEDVLKIDSVTTVADKTSDKNNQINIYPNPSNGNFVVETSTKQIVTVFDENGKIVLTQNINGTTAIDGSNLKAGTYNIVITNASTNDAIRKRIVIVK